ncbi:hypothetical protein [Methylocystis parvus]|uniref:Uncharacterized protein n=1 Tax=Methylocystis parvus TaxID=134 RepID=A0A6B8M8P5_9HYPH|nr:hypothetical protein [Methylocystis parvus]QGM97999.1 hypothetical protein F7D14_11275 [Methylocystis parvus]WBK01685.1 hypothetical protein MMG94_08295 [Methylocystis parvus OBBP]
MTYLLSKVARSRLAATEAAIAELRLAERAALEALDQYAPLVLRRLQRIAAQRVELETAIEPLRAQAKEYGRRAKLLERKLEETDDALRLEAARDERTRLLAATPSARGKSGGLASN